MNSLVPASPRFPTIEWCSVGRGGCCLSGRARVPGRRVPCTGPGRNTQRGVPHHVPKDLGSGPMVGTVRDWLSEANQGIA